MKYWITSILVIFIISNSSSQKETLVQKQAENYLQKLTQAYNLGDYKSHKSYSDSLYVFAKQNGLTKFQILGMVNQAVYHNNSGEQNKSIVLYRDALLLTDSIPEDYRSKIIVLVNLGNVYNKIKAYKKSITTMEEVISMLDTYEDNPKIRASAYNGLANNHNILGETQTSLEYHFKSKKLGEEIEDESIVVTALSNISDTYLEQQKYDKAIENNKMAMSFSVAQKPTKQWAGLLINRALAEKGLGNIKASITFLKEAQKMAADKGLTEIELQANKHLAEVYEVKKDSVNVKKANEQYLILKNKLLENSQLAIKLDLEKDISAKDVLLKNKLSKIKSLQKSENRLLLWSVVFASILLIVSLLFFIFRNRSLKVQRVLHEQFTALKEDFIPKDSDGSNNNYKTKTSIYKNSSLSHEDFKLHKQQLIELMAIDKPYLNSELSQTALASQLGISSHHLSEILNKGFNQNFYNFLNSYRVLAAQKLMDNDTNNESKILAFAFDSGFKSKTSFNRVFKAHTGLTPSEYRKKAKS
jgi:AraC-like DNA-binding protein